MIKSIIKRVIVCVCVGLIFSFINSCEVKAVTISYWGKNIDYTITRGVFYKWTSSSNYSEIESDGLVTLYFNNEPINVLSNYSRVQFNSYGISPTYMLNQYLDPNYMYSVSTYICSAGINLSNNTEGYMYPYMRLGSGYPNVLTTDMQYSYTQSVALSYREITLLNDDYYTSLDSCRIYTSIVQPSVRSNFASLKFTSNTSTMGKLYIVGYNIESLGLATNVITNNIDSVISNSGLATATSVNQVQQSVNQVKNEITGMQEKQDVTNQKLSEINNSLTSEEAPNQNEYNQLSGYNANNNVINNLVMMPVNLAQAYLNGISSSCSPFPLGNLLGTDLVLPCIQPQNYLGTLWNVIDVIISGIFIFHFGKKCVKIFNDVTNLKENQVDEVFD